METDTEDEEEERRTWIDDNDDACALIRPPGRRPYWRNLSQRFSQWHPPWEPPPGQGVFFFLAAVVVAQCLVRQWIHTLRQLEEALCTNFILFLRDWVDSGS